ncbi:thioesterase family protein [Acinetobacter gyllenbergii]|uniref:thioesterase family protein n=1 Tax=Acinetobacter proteolyticus TaxID=1776741 RepID=UPI00132F0F5D|nr:thioesterase family protein [Acinetobacter gyllenbergii]
MSLLPLYQQVEQQEWIDIPSGWLQGRTVFGGLIAGLMIQKAISTVQDVAKQLLSCNVTFVGPVQQGRARLSAEVLREGKSVTTLEVRLWQDDAVQSILVASFGLQRESRIHVQNLPQVPDYPMPEQLDKTFYIEGLMPECLQQFELCWAEGSYPMAGSKVPDFGGWGRFAASLHPNREMQLADLFALMDVWPPGVLPMFKTPAPASSLTWQITYLQPVNGQIQDWLKYKVITEYAEHGYSTEYAYVWDAENRLIAVLRQTVAVFA